MNILLLKGFNNYFNRILKKYSAITDYQSNSTSYVAFTGINFNPNDGITTELILGSTTQQENSKPLNWENIGTPDYLVCYEMEGTPAAAVIKSRWFVLESERTRNGQYRVALKRDVLAEHFDVIMNAPCFIEKGYVANSESPLLANSEGSVVNEIKKDEIPLKDATNCAWLVGYITKDAHKTDSVTMDKDLSIYTNASSLAWESCITFKDKNGTEIAATKTATTNAVSCKLYFSIYNSYYNVDHEQGNVRGNTVNTPIFAFNNSARANSNYQNVVAMALTSSRNNLNSDNAYRDDISEINNLINNNSSVSLAYSSMVNSCSDQVIAAKNLYATAENLLSWNNVYVSKNNKLYKLSVIKAPSTTVYNNTYTFNNENTAATNAKTFFTTIANNSTKLALNTNLNSAAKFSVDYETYVYTIVATETETPNALTYNIPVASSRNQVNDELFDIFAIPYAPQETITFKYNNNTYTLDSEASLFIATQIMTGLGTSGAGALAYDLQLLPYCPINLSTPINLSSLSTPTYTVVSDGNSNVKTFILFPTESNFTKNIDFEEKIKVAKNETLTRVLSNVSAKVDTGDTFKVETEVVSLHPLITAPLISIPSNFKSIVDYDVYINGELDGDAIFALDEIVDYSLVGGDNSWSFSVTNITKIDSAQTITLRIDMTIVAESAPNSLDLKVVNECEFYRLTSPNFNSMYQFKLNKFKDGIHYINVDCTYKPFSPYVKLNPDFSGLYGEDFNDSTGLILAGDFSLSVLNDRWVEYQLANKNYQQIFNRQIENLDVSNQIAQEQQQFNAIVGTITGTVGGAAGGALAGAKLGWQGAVGGAMVGLIGGGVLSTYGAEKDREWLLRQQAETKSYTVDMYNYQLGNIKALPRTISKSSPLTYNNKIWPIMEKFSCTDEEKNIIREKIKYNGMTIMAIGALTNFSVADDADVDYVYVKGQLIRLNEINDDFHIADAIYQEVNKGFYIKQ